MTNIIPIMHCFDNRYVIPAAISFQSMLRYANPDYSYKLYVLHTDITDENQKILKDIVSKFHNASLEFIDMKNKFKDIFDHLATKGHYSKEVLYKLLCGSIFSVYEKIIITDVDVLWKGDISYAWELCKGENDFYVAGVKKCQRKINSYIEGYKKDFTKDEIDMLGLLGGFLVFNLENIRKDNIEEKFISVLTENLHRLKQAEQDVINLAVPQNKRIYLPLKTMVCNSYYNMYEDECYDEDINFTANEIKDALDHPIQLHYPCSNKPWISPTCSKAEYWYEELSKSPYFYKQMALFEKDWKKKTEIQYYCLAKLPLVKIKFSNGVIDKIKFLNLFNLRLK